MKKIEFNVSSNDGTKLLLEAIHQDDLSNRIGYNKNFLGTELLLPNPPNGLENIVAKNPNPKSNGDNYLDYTHFSILFNKDKKLPFLTAVNIDGSTNELSIVHEKRTNDIWYQDERITVTSNSFQFKTSDYSGSGFDRGHMVRYYDPAWGGTKEDKKIAMGDTFHYTNCCPQLPNLNRNIWGDLEDYYMARAIFQDNKITVFTGPIFNKEKKIGNLLVPINFWKIIVYKKNDHLEAMGFIMSQELLFNKMLEEQLILEDDTKYSKPTLKQSDIDRLFTKNNIKQYVVKIALIEEKTGLNFGLNAIDANLNEVRLFNKPAIEPTADELEVKKMKYIMEYNTFKNDFNDSEFINNM